MRFEQTAYESDCLSFRQHCYESSHNIDLQIVVHDLYTSQRLHAMCDMHEFVFLKCMSDIVHLLRTV